MKTSLILLCLLISSFMWSQSIDTVTIEKQVDSLLQVCSDLTKQQNFEKALEVNSAAKNIALENLGRASGTYGKCCYSHGSILLSSRDLTGAEQCFIEAKTIQETALGKEHPDYGVTVSRLGIVYNMLGKYDQAEPLYIESMNIKKKAFGMESPDYAGSLVNLGILYDQTAKFEKAEQYLLEAKDIFESKLNNLEHPFYLNCLGNLGALYRRLGYYEKAEPIVLKVLTLRKKTMGKKNRSYAGSLMTLANLYIDLGDYAKVEHLYLEAKNIMEEVLGKDHPDYFFILNNLAHWYIKIGNSTKAESLLTEAKFNIEKAFGKEHPKYMSALINLAVANKNLGNYAKAENLYLEAKNLGEQIAGKEHMDYGMILWDLADLYNAMHQYEKAVPFYLESLVILENAVGKNHRKYGLILINLASLYEEMGNDKKAEQLALKAKDIWGNELGLKKTEYAINLKTLANVYERQNRFAESDLLLKEYLELTETLIAGSVTFLSGQELATYTATFQSVGDRLLSFLMSRWETENQQGVLSALCADHSLFQKGFLLTAANRLNALSIAYPEAKALSDQLNGYRRHLALEYTKPVAERTGIDDLEEKVATVEKELTRSVAGYAEAIQQVKWKEVQQQLQSNEAAIEFVRFQVNFPKHTDSIMYAALVLHPDIEQPRFVPLFEEQSLDSLFNTNGERKADYVNHLYTVADRGATAVKNSKQSLYDLIWQPLEKELASVQTVYYSPTGLLHRINLNAIPINDEETLADHFRLIEMGSTRQLVIPTEIKMVNNDALLLGGLQYEMDSTAFFLANEDLASETIVSRGELTFSDADSTMRGGTWNYLNWTEKEVTAIEEVLQEGKIQTTMLKNFAATEEAFKAIGKDKASPRILHIATHGFFFPDPKIEVSSGSKVIENEPVFKMSDHPMIRSGLIMAGGNYAWQTGTPFHANMEDGILTAYEISQMNLSNTELVVLSACETGLGDIHGNEGVYGLQRAFKIAGAKYLVMSLWQVPDKETAYFMEAFYRHMIEDEMSIPDAFNTTQQALRANPFITPYQWAGFVLVE